MKRIKKRKKETFSQYRDRIMNSKAGWVKLQNKGFQ